MRGKKGSPHLDPLDPPRRRANKQRGRGTYDNNRPAVVSVINRETGERRYWVVEHTARETTETTKSIIQPYIPRNGTILFTDEASNYTSVHVRHATACHSQREWACDDDGDGRREVHCNTSEGAGAALRTYLHPFRGVHKYYLAEYVATFEALGNAKRITLYVIHRMCFGTKRLHTNPSGDNQFSITIRS